MSLGACPSCSDPDIDTLIDSYALLIDYERRMNELLSSAAEDAATCNELASLTSQAAALTATTDALAERLRVRGIAVPPRIAGESG